MKKCLAWFLVAALLCGTPFALANEGPEEGSFPAHTFAPEGFDVSVTLPEGFNFIYSEPDEDLINEAYYYIDAMCSEFQYFVEIFNLGDESFAIDDLVEYYTDDEDYEGVSIVYVKGRSFVLAPIPESAILQASTLSDDGSVWVQVTIFPYADGAELNGYTAELLSHIVFE